jgi:hypothetical protein
MHPPMQSEIQPTRSATRLPTRSSAAGGVTWLLIAAVLALAFLILAQPIPQDQDYHLFADQRSILGIPNFWNVISNLPFLLVGVLGLRGFRDAASRILFAGVVLTSFGSGYYHLHPNDATLVWDRLPITLVFMPLLALVISQWIGPVWGRRLLWPLVLFGIGSVVWWRFTGDLRPYAVAQFGPALVLLPAFWFDRTIRGLWPAGVLYMLAKVAETFDRGIYTAIPVSGHTLKHLAAALATLWILRWRRSLPPLAMKLN